METPVSVLYKKPGLEEPPKAPTVKISTEHSYSSLIRDCKVEIRKLTLSEISRIGVNPFTITVRCKVCNERVDEGPRCARKCRSFFHLKCAFRVAVCCGASILPYSGLPSSRCPECRGKVQFGPSCITCLQVFHTHCVGQFTTCCSKFLQTRKSQELGCSLCLLPMRLGPRCPNCSRSYHSNCIDGAFPCCRHVKVNLGTVVCQCASCSNQILLPGVVCTVCWNLYHRKCIRSNRKCCGLDLGDILFSPRLDIVRMGPRLPLQVDPSTSATPSSTTSPTGSNTAVAMALPSKTIVRTVKISKLSKKPYSVNIEEIHGCKNGEGSPKQMIVFKRRDANGKMICSKGVFVKSVKKDGKTDLETLKSLFSKKDDKTKKNGESSGTNSAKIQKSPEKVPTKSSLSLTPEPVVAPPSPQFVSANIKSEVIDDDDDEPVLVSPAESVVPTNDIEMPQIDSKDNVKSQIQSNAESRSDLVSDSSVGTTVGDKDALKDFFSLLYDTVKQFPPQVQTEVKFNLFKTVSEAELQLHNKK